MKERITKSLALLCTVTVVALLSGCAWTPGPEIEKRATEIKEEEEIVRQTFPMEGEQYSWLNDQEIQELEVAYSERIQQASEDCGKVLVFMRAKFDADTGMIPAFIKRPIIAKGNELVCGTKEKPTAIGILLGEYPNIIEFISLYATMKTLQNAGRVTNEGFEVIDAAAIKIGAILLTALPPMLVRRDAVALNEYGKEMKVFYENGRKAMEDCFVFTKNYKEYSAFLRKVEATKEVEKCTAEEAFTKVKGWVLMTDNKIAPEEQEWPKIEAAIDASKTMDPEGKGATLEPVRNRLLGTETGLTALCNSALSTTILNIQKILNLALGVVADTQNEVGAINDKLSREKEFKDKIMAQYKKTQKCYSLAIKRYQMIDVAAKDQASNKGAGKR